MRLRRVLLGPLAALLLASLGCRPSESSPQVPAAAPEEPAPPSSSGEPPAEVAPLGYSGDRPPEVFPETLRATPSARGTLGDLEVRGFRLDPRLLDAMRTETRRILEQGTEILDLSVEAVVRDAEGRLHPRTFVTFGRGEGGEDEGAMLWVATRRGETLAPESSVLLSSLPGRARRFRVRLEEGAASSMDVARGYRAALVEWFERMPRSSFAGFATARLGGRSAEGRAGRVVSAAEPLRAAMSLFSGHRSVELAIAEESDARLGRAKETRALTTLAPADLPTHDYAAMLRKLGGSSAGPKIFSAVPAEFYAIHATSGATLFEALRQGESVAAPALRLLEDAKESAEVRERTLRRLGLVPTELSEKFGPEVIEEVVLVGSDPFVARGSDVTLLFRAKEPRVFSLGLAASAAAAAEGHGELRTENVAVAGRSFSLVGTVDEAVRRFEGRIGDYFVVGNSRAALERLVLVDEGKAPRLADEPDFRYLQTRDERQRTDVLAFAGDRFFRALASPRARVLDARRRMAATELRRVGYAQILGRLLGLGESATLAELVRQGLLRSEELVHFDGSRIELDARGVARSRYGTAAELVPLLELPTPTKVTEEESVAYAEFAREYARVWGRAVDPVMLRLAFEPTRVAGKLRVFPIAADGEILEFLDFVGGSRFDGKRAAAGLRFAVAIAEQSSLRRTAESFGPNLVGRSLSLGWLGDVAFVGVLDEPSLERAVAPELAPLAPLEERSERGFEALFEAPLYAGLAVKSPRQASLFLDVLRAALAKEGGLRFSTVGKVGAHEIVEVAFSDGGLAVRGYYALGEQALYVAFEPRVLELLLGREARGEEPRGGTQLPLAEASQVELSLRQAPSSALRRVLGWLHELENPRPTEQLDWYRVLVAATGSPEASTTRAFALARFGAVPLSRDGRPLEFDERGVVEPGRGSLFHPTFPELPAPGSDLARLLTAFRAMVLSLAFEPEVSLGSQPEQSLRVRFDLERGAPAP